MKMEKYRCYRNKHIFVVYVQNSVKMTHLESDTVFQLHEHTHGALTWFHSTI